MLHKSPLFHWIHIAAMIIAGVAAVLIGLMPFGINILDQEFLRNPNVVMVLEYVLLAAGIILLVCSAMKLTGACGCHCADKKNSPYA